MLASIASAPASTTFFAHERAATSLQDLDIVRKIVEREGCLEALTQLLTTHARVSKASSSKAMVASASLAAAPMVVTSLLDQLRGVSVQIVEGIDVWKRMHQDHDVFQWRNLNYLAKMLADTDFLALHGAVAAQLTAFHGLRLERNPFLAPLHLDHAALKEPTADMACRSTLFVGTVDMKRIFHASRLLLQEQDSLGSVSTSNDVMSPLMNTTRRHWSHRPMKLAVSTSAPTLPPSGASMDPRAAMAFDIELAKELVFQHEHELGAMKEELAVLQRRLQTDLVLVPDKKRTLQTRIAGLQHDIKLRTGDLFHRRNELQRKEAVIRMDKRRLRRAQDVVTTLHQQPSLETTETSHCSVTETFRAALEADELRRQDLVDKFATFTKQQAAVSVTKRTLQSLGSTTPSRRVPVERMTVVDVETLVAALPLGDDAARYGALLRAKGIDGVLLAQAQDRDLEELGITTRLHRVKILEAVAKQTQRR